MSAMRKLGYLQDPAKSHNDKQDWPFARLMQTRQLSSIKPLVDNSRYVAIQDQETLGSCVAHGVGGAVRAKNSMDGIPDPKFLDRLITYWGARAYIGLTHEDSGSHIRDAFRFINKAGFLPEEESFNGYDVSKFKDGPTDTEKSQMFDQKDKGQGQVRYYRITEQGASRTYALKLAMTNGGFPVIGTETTYAFLDYTKGVLAKPAEADTKTGGHAFMLCGYTPDYAIAANSWGKDWGEDGFMRISWDYIEWDQTRDIWVVDKAPYFSHLMPSKAEIQRELARQAGM